MGPAKLDPRLEAIENSLQGLEAAFPALSSDFESAVNFIEQRLAGIERKSDHTRLLLVRVLAMLQELKGDAIEPKIVMMPGLELHETVVGATDVSVPTVEVGSSEQGQSDSGANHEVEQEGDAAAGLGSSS